MIIEDKIKKMYDKDLLNIVKDYDHLEKEGWTSEDSALRNITNEVKYEMNDDRPNFMIIAHAVATKVLRELVRRTYDI